MSKTICIECEVEYQQIKSGNPIIEMFSNPQKPYKIWSADRWECPKCNHQIISGFGYEPITEHFNNDFEDILNKVKNNEFVVYSYEK